MILAIDDFLDEKKRSYLFCLLMQKNICTGVKQAWPLGSNFFLFCFQATIILMNKSCC